MGTWTIEAFGVMGGDETFSSCNRFKFFPSFSEPRGDASAILNYYSTDTLFMNYAIGITQSQPQLNLIKPKLVLTRT